MSSKSELAALARAASVPVTRIETGVTALNRSAHDWYVAARDPIERKARSNEPKFKMSPATAHDMRSAYFTRAK